MTDRRMDPEMAAFSAMMAERMAKLPPIILPNPPRSGSFDEPRRINDAPQISVDTAGPAMAESRDIWLPIRGRRMQLRFHRPSNDPNLPVLIYMHGGGWVWGSIDTHDRLMRGYAAASGCAVLGPDYALSPEAVFPQALEECAAVMHHVAKHGAELGLDRSRIILGGDSAGANIAAGVALLDAEMANPVKLAGLLLNYGVFDHVLDTPSYREFADGYGLTLAKMRFYWDAYCPDAVARLSPFASPIRGDLAELPPTLLHIAELDVLAAENLAFAEKLRSAGVSLELQTFPGTVHGFLRALGQVGVADRAVEAAGAWLKARFGI
ncbi:MAG: alpha/beta hydrolase [Rubritepida sp.]|nr:alpha/beta hydrolase [Rubritepida sp.]